jgi:hypothetical protein
MTEPMTDGRLAQIRVCPPPPFADDATQVVYGVVRELLDEVERLRAAAWPEPFAIDAGDVTDEQVQKWRQHWDVVVTGGGFGSMVLIDDPGQRSPRCRCSLPPFPADDQEAAADAREGAG